MTTLRVFSQCDMFFVEEKLVFIYVWFQLSEVSCKNNGQATIWFVSVAYTDLELVIEFDHHRICHERNLIDDENLYVLPAIDLFFSARC